MNTLAKLVIDTLAPLAEIISREVGEVRTVSPLGLEQSAARHKGEAIAFVPVRLLDAVRDLHAALAVAETLGAPDSAGRVIVRTWGVESVQRNGYYFNVGAHADDEDALRGVLMYFVSIGAMDPSHVPPRGLT